MSADKNNKRQSPLLDWMPKGEPALQILEARAAGLREGTRGRDMHKQREFVTYIRCRLGDHETYGIPYAYVKEVLLNTKSTRVPEAPPYLTGVINHYGSLLSILDLKSFFHLSKTKDEPEPYWVVVSAAKMTLALSVDDIEGSDAYDKKQLAPPLGTEDAVQQKYIIGLDQGTTAILNMEALLSDLQAHTTARKENP